MNTTTKRIIENGILRITSDKTFANLQFTKKSIQIKLSDKPSKKGAYRLSKNRLLLPKRIVEAYGLYGTYEVRYIDADTYEIAVDIKPKRVPQEYEANIGDFTYSSLNNLQEYNAKSRPLHDASSINLPSVVNYAVVHVSIGKRKFAEIRRIDEEEYYEMEDVLTMEELRKEYGRLLQSYPADEYCFKIHADSKKISLGALFASVNAKFVDLYEFKDKYIVVPVVFDEITNNQIDTTRREVVNVSLCPDCNDEVALLAHLTEKLAVISQYVEEITAENDSLKTELQYLKTLYDGNNYASAQSLCSCPVESILL